MAKVAGGLLVSAAGWIGSLVCLLVELAEEAGMTLEDVHRLVTPQGKAVLRQMAVAMVAVMKEARGLFSYDITIDYGQTVEQMVVAGCYDWANENINTANFGEEIKAKEDKQEKLSFVLLHLNRGVTSQEALAEIERRGLRPATLAELLAFGAGCPDVQREFPVVSLGSSCVLDGGRRVAYLWSFASRRSLDLGCFDGHWCRCRFLAVSK